jgi:hypothetical protein
MSDTLRSYLDRTAAELAATMGPYSPADPLFTALSRAYQAVREAALEAGSPSIHPRTQPARLRPRIEAPGGLAAE